MTETDQDWQTLQELVAPPTPEGEQPMTERTYEIEPRNKSFEATRRTFEYKARPGENVSFASPAVVNAAMER